MGKGKFYTIIYRIIFFFKIKGIKNLNVGGKITVSSKNTITLQGKAYFGPNCYLGANLNVDGDLLVGPNVCFVGDDHRIPKRSEKTSYIDSGRDILREIKIEKNVWIGANSTILTGVTLAEGSIIAAGTVVTKSTKPYTIYGSSKQFKIKEII
ncbi:MAG: acyltransferase [Bacteroidota bacterium]|nr:acyltransferase [Bacteroidota bacterium]